MSGWIEDLRNMPHFYAEKGASSVQIERAEELLNLKFAPDFKECLHEFGAISVAGHELTGFSTDGNLDVVRVTQKHKQKYSSAENLYVIEEAHIDGIVVWQGADGSVYEARQHSSPAKIAGSLIEYLSMD